MKVDNKSTSDQTRVPEQSSDNMSPEARSGQREWTPEYVQTLMLGSDRKFHDAIAEEHNAALAAERQRATYWELRCRESRQQLLSAQAAIEKHNKGVLHKDRLADINVDLSALREHDAEVRNPLVGVLEWYATATYPDDGSGRPPEALQRRAKDALAKVKEGKSK